MARPGTANASAKQKARPPHDDGGPHGGHGPRRRTSRWEWAAAALGSAVVIATVIFLVYQGLTAPAHPHPNVVIRRGFTARVANGYLVRLDVENRGDATAASLQVQGTLLAGTDTVEQTQATLDFVPAHATRRAGLFFARDPAHYQLSVRPLGYDTP